MRKKTHPSQDQDSEEEKPGADPLIITESELLKLSPKEREAFRLNGGTVTLDPK